MSEVYEGVELPEKEVAVLKEFEKIANYKIPLQNQIRERGYGFMAENGHVTGIMVSGISRYSESLRKLPDSLVDLTELKAGESGIVVKILGGRGLIQRLEIMGVRLGKKITKTSAQFWHGPQTVKIDNSQVAIGYGMAKRIFIEVKG